MELTTMAEKLLEGERDRIISARLHRKKDHPVISVSITDAASGQELIHFSQGYETQNPFYLEIKEGERLICRVFTALRRVPLPVKANLKVEPAVARQHIPTTEYEKRREQEIAEQVRRPALRDFVIVPYGLDGEPWYRYGPWRGKHCVRGLRKMIADIWLEWLGCDTRPTE